MKKFNVLLLIIGIFLISVGIGGYVITSENNDDEIYGYSMMNQVWSDDSGYRNEAYLHRGSMMPSRYNYNSINDNGEPYELEELTQEVKECVGRYDQNLVIDSILIFEDTEYYYLIIEENTGKGAMELLVNPYTKDIYPEYGPNMMWNLKYGRHYNGGMMKGRGVMEGSRMMRFYDDDDHVDYSNLSKDNEITGEEAYNEGVQYLVDRDKDLTLSKEYREFYGYYTFHVIKNGGPKGMLSVNGFTGDLWYHDWHGELVATMSSEEEDTN